jgi:flagellar protein FlaG
MTESINILKHNMDPGAGEIRNHPLTGSIIKSSEANHHNQEVTKEDLDRTIHALKEYIDSNRTSLDISIDNRTNMVVVKIISQEDGSVIREIPSEEIVEHAARMKQLEGLLFDRNV